MSQPDKGAAAINITKCVCSWKDCAAYQRAFFHAKHPVFDGVIQLKFSQHNAASVALKTSIDRCLQVSSKQSQAWKPGKREGEFTIKYHVACHHYKEPHIQKFLDEIAETNSYSFFKPFSLQGAEKYLYSVGPDQVFSRKDDNDDAQTDETLYLQCPNVPNSVVQQAVARLTEEEEVNDADQLPTVVVSSAPYEGPEQAPKQRLTATAVMNSLAVPLAPPYESRTASANNNVHVVPSAPSAQDPPFATATLVSRNNSAVIPVVPSVPVGTPLATGQHKVGSLVVPEQHQFYQRESQYPIYHHTYVHRRHWAVAHEKPPFPPSNSKKEYNHLDIYFFIWYVIMTVFVLITIWHVLDPANRDRHGSVLKVLWGLHVFFSTVGTIYAVGPTNRLSVKNKRTREKALENIPKWLEAIPRMSIHVECYHEIRSDKTTRRVPTYRQQVWFSTTDCQDQSVTADNAEITERLVQVKTPMTRLRVTKKIHARQVLQRAQAIVQACKQHQLCAFIDVIIKDSWPKSAWHPQQSSFGGAVVDVLILNGGYTTVPIYAKVWVKVLAHVLIVPSLPLRAILNKSVTTVDFCVASFQVKQGIDECDRAYFLEREREYEAPEKNMGTRSRERVYSTHDDLEVLNLVERSMWMFDVANKCMWWANEQAVNLRRADDLSALLQRDFASEMSIVMGQQLEGYIAAFEKGEKISVDWNFYPNGVPVSAEGRASGIRINDGRIAILVEATEKKLTKESGKASIST